MTHGSHIIHNILKEILFGTSWSDGNTFSDTSNLSAVKHQVALQGVGYREIILFGVLLRNE